MFVNLHSMADVLVVGAGLAGLAAARDLARAGYSVHVLEKSRGVSGRAATTRLELPDQTIIRADHGAQFFTVRGERLGALLPALLETGIVREWTRGVSRFSDGRIEHPRNGHPRYACPDGISTLGKVLARGFEPGDLPLNIEFQSLVSAAWPSRGGWTVVLENGELRHGRMLIVNAPAPQALAISGSNLPPDQIAALEAIRFDPCWAAVIALNEPARADWLGLELDHDVLSWAALDHTKRAPGSPEVLVLHAQAGWSRTHLELSSSVALELMQSVARELFGSWVTNSRAAVAHRWRYANPVVSHPEPFVAHENLVLCGDWCAGPRIEGALESGWAAATYLHELLSPSLTIQA